MERNYNDFAISQSCLKDWGEMTPIKWYKTWYTKEIPRPPKPATTVGSFLDCLIFSPDAIDKRFIVSTTKLPSLKVQLILTGAFNEVETLNKNSAAINKENGEKGLKMKVPMKEHTLEDKLLIVKHCVENDHYANKPDQAYNDVLKKGTEYFEFLKTMKGRQAIAPADNLLAIELKKILYEDPVSKGFFEPKKDCEVIFQQKLYVDYDLSGFDALEFLPLKGIPDIIHFNHKLKQIREVDLKYTEGAYPSFVDRIRQFDYPQQHSFYDYLIKEWLKRYKDGKYKNYAVMPPLNLVIDPVDKTPYIYFYDADDMEIKRKGIEGTKIKGWEQKIEEIAWHFNKADWSRPREHIMNGYLRVKLFNTNR